MPPRKTLLRSYTKLRARPSLSANMSETVTPWEFSVEGASQDRER
jgi:hypothetical protein